MTKATKRTLEESNLEEIIMSALDEEKEKMPDGLYKRICVILQESKKRTDAKMLVRIKYFYQVAKTDVIYEDDENRAIFHVINIDGNHIFERDDEYRGSVRQMLQSGKYRSSWMSIPMPFRDTEENGLLTVILSMTVVKGIREDT